MKYCSPIPPKKLSKKKEDLFNPSSWTTHWLSGSCDWQKKKSLQRCIHSRRKNKARHQRRYPVVVGVRKRCSRMVSDCNYYVRVTQNSAMHWNNKDMKGGGGITGILPTVKHSGCFCCRQLFHVKCWRLLQHKLQNSRKEIQIRPKPRCTVI